MDSEFTKDLFDALNRFYDRLKERQKPVSEEEDKRSLNEVKAMEESRKEIYCNTGDK